MITTYFLEFDTIPTYTFPAKTAYPCGKVTPTLLPSISCHFFPFVLGTFHTWPSLEFIEYRPFLEFLISI